TCSSTRPYRSSSRSDTSTAAPPRSRDRDAATPLRDLAVPTTGASAVASRRVLRPALAPLLSIAVLLALAAGCGGTPDDRAASSDPTTTAPGTTSRVPSPTT